MAWPSPSNSPRWEHTPFSADGRGSALEKTAAAIQGSGGQSTVIECDLIDLSSVESLAEQVGRDFGRLDILVNNAGVRGEQGPLHELAPDSWESIVNTNLRGVYYMIRALAPLMIRARSGHIINISSLAGKNPIPNGAAYAASKWGLNGLSYSVAEELRAHNIRVAVICPGSVHTEFTPHTGKDAEKDAARERRGARCRHDRDAGAANRSPAKSCCVPRRKP